MFGGGIVCCGNGDAQGTVESLRAWNLSSQWMLDVDEWKECFGDGRNNKELALKYSRKRFKKRFPEYYMNVKYNSCFSDEKKKEAFNIFYDDSYEDTLVEEAEDAMVAMG